jgi:hypothetical protein
VFFGKSKCNVFECSDKWIKCQTINTNMIHEINNNGKDNCNNKDFFCINLKNFLFYRLFNQDYGQGYAWNNPFLNINKGDYVRWSWSSPNALGGIKYSVQQVPEPTSTEPSGFNSGSPSSSGKNHLNNVYINNAIVNFKFRELYLSI